MTTSQVLGLAMQAYVPGGHRKIHPELDLMFIPLPDVLIAFNAYIERMAGFRVLIVDDVEKVRQDLHTFLSLAGDIEIVGEAGNGQEAIRLVEALRPQVVLIDLEMPVMDGFEAARQIKALHPACRVIALTIHGDEAVRRMAMEVGADDFVVKGAPLRTLIESIHSTPVIGRMPEGDKK